MVSRLSILLLCVVPVVSSAQCILANPSFEVGATGAAFGGWNQFGTVAATANAAHGQVAARLRGPDLGGWDLSAVWQQQDTVEGERWTATGWVLHEASAPVTGASQALVNVEWRDDAGELISYETHPVIVAGDQVEVFDAFTIESAPAPAGAVDTRILLGVLQAPGEPSPAVVFDQVTFLGSSAPTLDEQQWFDFPGGRSIDFAGHTWRVKGPGWYGPGPNWFCDGPECTWVDANGDLHLTVSHDGNAYVSTELALTEPLGFGDYRFTTIGRVDLLDPNVVLGLFLWQYGPCWDPSYGWWNPYDEIDVEVSRWGDPNAASMQFVAQPYDWNGNLERFDATLNEGERVTFAFRWLPDRVEYRAWRGGPHDEPADELSASMLHTWTYTGPHVPRPEQPRVHLNLWYIAPPGSDQEVVLDDFVFEAACVEPYCFLTGVDGVTTPSPHRLLGAVPNPFNPMTEIVFELAHPAFARLSVFDVAGRHVRDLHAGATSGGVHRVQWDGTDARGSAVASGVYVVRLEADDDVLSQQVALVR